MENTMKIIDIGIDFSTTPIGRYYKDKGDNGEKFREEMFWPALRGLDDGEKLQLLIDNEVEGYGSSFLVEGIAGVVKYGYMTKERLLSSIVIEYSNKDFKFYDEKIKQYIDEAIYDSVVYKSTKGMK